MKFNVTILVFTFLMATVALAQNQSPVYLAYINQYYPLAIKQQKEYGIPASITLAQGLLESSAGMSQFAQESNNHFGIKCTDWAGERIYHDDDKKSECFRKYTQVEQSYEDHSLFLKKRARYAALFKLDPTDYQGWAIGLRKAGYATDPAYSYKLISIIEDYKLHKYDLAPAADPVKTVDAKPVSEASQVVLPKPLVYGQIGTVKPVSSHNLFRVNGVKFVVARQGDTYASIANEFDLAVDHVLFFNDLDQQYGLEPGTRVFIEVKKHKAPQECPYHLVESGESMYSISQDYGVQVADLYTINDMSNNQTAVIGQNLKLR